MSNEFVADAPDFETLRVLCEVKGWKVESGNFPDMSAFSVWIPLSLTTTKQKVNGKYLIGSNWHARQWLWQQIQARTNE